MVLVFLFERINATALCGSRLIADESGETPPLLQTAKTHPLFERKLLKNDVHTTGSSSQRLDSDICTSSRNTSERSHDRASCNGTEASLQVSDDIMTLNRLVSMMTDDDCTARSRASCNSNVTSLNHIHIVLLVGRQLAARCLSTCVVSQL